MVRLSRHHQPASGEHTADDFGFMNSAVETGERAATQVMDALGVKRARAA